MISADHIEVQQHEKAEADAIPAKCREVVLADIAHEEADGQDGHAEGDRHADEQHAKLRAADRAEFHDLQQRRAEHHGHGEEERVFRGDLARRADEDAAERAPGTRR